MLHGKVKFSKDLHTLEMYTGKPYQAIFLLSFRVYDDPAAAQLRTAVKGLRRNGCLHRVYSRSLLQLFVPMFKTCFHV